MKTNICKLSQDKNGLKTILVEAEKIANYGDVVLYYETDKAIKSKSIRRLMNCYPAVIRGISKMGISLEYYPDITTVLTKKRELQKAEELCGGEYRYSHEDYNRFPCCTVNLDLFKQYLVNKDGIEGVYELDTLNTIYAVFEDRKINYNKKEFLNKYFKKSKPVYDEIKGK